MKCYNCQFGLTYIENENDPNEPSYVYGDECCICGGVGKIGLWKWLKYMYSCMKKINGDIYVINLLSFLGCSYSIISHLNDGKVDLLFVIISLIALGNLYYVINIFLSWFKISKN